MSKTTNIEINGDALKAELFRRGYTLVQASNELGQSDSYISNIAARGEMPQKKCQAFERVFGIRPEKYVVQEKQLEIEAPKTETVVDGNMIRNIDVEFIRFRAHEIGLPLKSFCDVMGKRDNYLFNLRTNGATKDDFERMKLILRLEADDDRLIRKPQQIEAAPAETVEEIRTKLHKHEAKIAALQTEIKKLKELTGEILEQNAAIIKQTRGINKQ